MFGVYGQSGAIVYGENFDIDTATVPEDLWTAGGEYAFPTTAASTTVQSTDAADADGGTGAQTIYVQGLDADYKLIEETATLDGVTPVALTNQYLRILAARVVTAGTGETNAGVITVQHGATVLAHMTAGSGRASMAIYTIPADYNAACLTWLFGSVGRTANPAYVRLEVRYRLYGGAWVTLGGIYLQTNGANWVNYPVEPAQYYPPKTDLKMHCAEASANDLSVSGRMSFTLHQKADLDA